MADLVLASASPRRIELLSRFEGHSLRVAPSEIAEETAGPARGAVEELSRLKALAADFRAGEVVIAADTLVEIDGLTLGKPRGADGARAMLNRLSGRWHGVHTGVTVHDGQKTLTARESTRVRFAALDARDIEAYIASGEPMDKAGAYGIQGRGALFVEAIDGDFYNVMGLPLFRLARMLREFGVSL
ncbi:MAG: Maf family protein [Oscillospiraceae bacterium]|nr:Maf family protein [Oscillospiraceae bacterium]